MTTRTQQIRAAIGEVIALDAEWRAKEAGHDDLATYLPWMPFSWPDFIALVAEALPEAPGDEFLDVGAGVGTKMMLAEKVFGLETTGIERVPEYVKEAQSRGQRVIETDALTWYGYGRHDIVFFNRPFYDQDLQAQLEQRVWENMKSGAVVIAVNLLAPPPPSWYLILDDREVRRWIFQKP